MARTATSPQCMHCGKLMWQIIDRTTDPPTETGTYGFEGNGRFCSRKCGYAWALNVIDKLEGLACSFQFSLRPDSRSTKSAPSPRTGNGPTSKPATPTPPSEPASTEPSPQ